MRRPACSIAIVAAALAGCAASVPAGAHLHGVGGTVAGLLGSGLVLQNGGVDQLPVWTNGAFGFAGRLAEGARYAVTVRSQPGSPAQTCSVDRGSGTVGGDDVTDVRVVCVTDPPPRHAVGGTVVGLGGSGLVLRNSGGDDLRVSASGGFTFPTPLPEGAPYDVSVRAQPRDPSQRCKVTGGSGVVGTTDVTTVAVSCRTRLLCFTSDDPSTARLNLWCIDGTEGGARLVVPARAGGEAANPDSLSVVGDDLFFAAGHQEGRVIFDRALWKTDGTEAGTVLVRAVDQSRNRRTGPNPGVVEVAGVGYFAGAAIGEGCELWRTDGTAAGTLRVAAIGTSRSGSEPRNLVAANGALYFLADDGAHGLELWRSTGTAAGTALVADLVPGPATGVWEGWTPVHLGGEVLFPGLSGAAGMAPWWTTGRGTGVTLPVDLRVDPLLRPIAAGGRVWLVAADDVHGYEIWLTDGTPAGTFMVRDVLPDSLRNWRPFPLSVLGETLLFLADDGVHGTELWRSDGTEAGTALVKDVCPGACEGLTSGEAVVAGPVLLFVADDGWHGPELWRTDGTEGGTWLVRDIVPGPTGSSPHGFTAIDEVAYFVASDEAGVAHVWRSDGSEAGTRIVWRNCALPECYTPGRLTAY